MRSKLIRDQGPVRTFVVVLDPGEEVVACLRTFATEENLIAAQVTAIGALSDVVLGFFDPEAKAYHATPVREQVEVLSLLGNVAQHRGKPKVHAHIVVGKRDGTALGGHLVEAHVRPTLEVVVEEAPHHLRRETDEATGLALLTAE
jgi:predicted DNA-binding protein with PD1-like motif